MLIRTALTVVTVVILAGSLLAKPMPAPDPLEARARSVAIVEAKYVGRVTGGNVTYFGGTVAKYRVERVLAGASPGRDIKVFYAFHDGSACIEDRSWRFSESMMPRPGSRWVLFLQRLEGGIYSTYRGDYGRWEASPQNQARVRSLLEP